MRLGSYEVDGWLDRGPAHQMFRSAEGDLVYRLLPTATAKTRELFRPTLDLLVAALREPTAGGPPLVAADLATDEYLLVFEDVRARPTHTIRNPLAPALALGLAAKVLAGLKPLHDRELFHGALHPERIGIYDDGSLVLQDTGPALLADADPERRLSPSVPGFTDLYPEPAFVPPEVFNWEPLSPAADVFLVAALTYWWMTGGTPAHGTGRALEVYARLRDGQHAEFPRPGNLHLAAIDVLDAALSPDPKARPTSSELAAVLRPFETIQLAQLTELTGPPASYSSLFGVSDPEDAPGPPGSPAEQRRQEALRRATMQLEVMRTSRPSPRRTGGGTFSAPGGNSRSRSVLPLLILVLIVGIAVPLIITRNMGGGDEPAPPLVRNRADTTASESDAGPIGPEEDVDSEEPEGPMVVRVGPAEPISAAMPRRRQPEPESRVSRMKPAPRLGGR